MKSSVNTVRSTLAVRSLNARTAASATFPRELSPTRDTTTVSASSTPAPTGITRWWTYERSALPGSGQALVNVVNGNLVITTTDIDIPERGIDLTFARTYNSMSQHTASNEDGSVASSFGDGWTNSLDAHIATNAAQNVMSVYDIDGARYDYTANGNGGWTPPPGMQATTLTYDGSCAYYWTLKSGLQYVFYAPFATSCNGTSDSASMGRLVYVFGRNSNNFLHLAYSWNGGDNSEADLASITVRHSDGQQLILQMETLNGHSELDYITLPNGTSVNYAYDPTPKVR